MFRTVGLRQSLRAPRFAQLPRRFNSTTAKEGKMNLKTLAKKYGWVATGVYLGLSLIDLPLCYLTVHSLGTEKFIGYEMYLREKSGYEVPRDETYVGKAAQSKHGIFLTELTVAYLIHKSLIVFRLPLTVSITPGIARKLSGWGFKVGPAAVKTAGSAAAAGAVGGSEAAKNAAKEAVKKEVGKNFGTRPNSAKRWFSGFF